jgi:hypothetical protein
MVFNMTSLKVRGKYVNNVRDNNGLTEQVLLQSVPSMFAGEAHESRSSKYVYIPTIEIVKNMLKEGFVPVQAMQGKSRTEEKMNFTKHLVRFRKQNELGLSFPESSEIILLNSHDGSTSYHLMDGIFRTVCANGLISGDLENNFKVRHSGDIIGDVIQASYRIVDSSEETKEKIQEMKSIDLSQFERNLLAEYSIKARYNIDDEENEGETIEQNELPIPAYKALTIRRQEDRKDDLFTTMNVIQENLIKGGISARGKDGKRKTVRAVNGIDQNVKVNKLIWSFAEEIRKAKQTV